MAKTDNWSGLDHKAGMGGNGDGNADFSVPGWVKRDEDIRRLRAYEILGSYVETKARQYVLPDSDASDQELTDLQADYREYGEPGLMVERIAAGLMGEDPTVAIIGVDDPLPSSVPLPDAPQEPPDDLEPVQAKVAKAAYEAELRVYDQRSQGLIEQWELDQEERAAKEAADEWLKKWAEDEDLMALLAEAEMEWVIALAEAVYQVGWSTSKQRPTITLHHPESYFPDLDTVIDGQFPTVVRIAYQYEIEVDGESEEFVRRQTWELWPLEPGEDEEPAPADLGPRPSYLTAEDEHTHSCLYSDETFPADDFDDVHEVEIGAGSEFGTVELAGGEPVEANRIALGLDYIPLVHMPNTLSRSGRHYGRSHLTRMAQLADEIAGHDADEGLAGTWAGHPPVAASGVDPSAERLVMDPATVLKLSEKGSVTVIEMAQNLDVLLKRNDQLMRRWSVNGSVPETLLGRVDPSQVPSGFALVMTFTSFKQLVGRMRLAREAKNRLLLKMVQRTAIHNGDETIGDTVWPATVQYGPFMPQDLSSLVQILNQAVTANIISQETAIAMLAEGGVPSGDTTDELAAIRAAMTAEADQIADATGSVEAAREFLGLPPGDDEEQAALEASDPASGEQGQPAPVDAAV